ncbi:2-amino-4-hydroxy-6-hydroxymethyldihydropteridine diphosphokinase [Methylophaga sp.]|uniref:2-amino-4-hydroxy-6- hydroxymethyldihydropteridine diphosphokinase n=1 Tax=Methylophaga sp. TaxID=2024840 RepID=UPI003F6A4DD9
MSPIRAGYLLGLGSNIDPFDNFAHIATSLLHRFDHIHLSRVLHIPPVGMNSQHYFLNAVAFIETDMEEADLKHICNEIEIALGRDRDDPDSKHKDRPADLDILAYMSFPRDSARETSNITDEYFLYPIIDEIKAYLSGKAVSEALQQGTEVQADTLSFGKTATTIYRDGNTG